LDYMLKFVDHSRLNSQHNWEGGWGDRCGHLMSSRIHTLIMNKIFI
jgi:hypothetical protein